MRWVIVGCGYSGERLAARALERGDAVTATSRRESRLSELASRLPGLETRRLDLAAAAPPHDLGDLGGAVVVVSAPPSSEDGEPEARLARAAAAAGAGRLIYLSSTGVYGRGDGGWVTEDSPTEPISEHGRRRLAAETAILGAADAAGLEAAALRIAGIYGPGRGVIERLRRGDYRVIGDGAAHVSRVHVDDLVSAILCAATAAALPHRVYNVADDEPTSSREHADGVAALLGLAPPPSVPLEEASARARAMLGADRRISNRRIKRELGLTLRYPSWREGAAAILAS